MDKRILWGCIAALGLLMLFAWVTMLFGARMNQALATPLGELPLLDLLGVLVAMTAGGAIAGPRFARIAAALVALVWVLSIAVLSTLPAPSMSVAAVLRFNALAMALSLAFAVLGARVGAQCGAQCLARISRRA
ncbi:hypothetical protein MNR01_09980 [Lysobacter sp. S4-A87]|uniref:hypothetical protein n=1 Tax=Lysobacter sp. S4-A87 TaxID=2925843 RepID=UPI001F52E9C3|nr:hypothetical protein [Lysobacter sp. S4-A87]UNK48107.1 hypothetical protein MNR01_09980 [Lysobacter sp. S4-A87]